MKTHTFYDNVIVRGFFRSMFLLSAISFLAGKDAASIRARLVVPL
jgi:hypothetical protein